MKKLLVLLLPLLLVSFASASVTWYNSAINFSTGTPGHAQLYINWYDNGGSCASCYNLTLEYNNGSVTTNTTFIRNNDPWFNVTAPNQDITLPPIGVGISWRWYANSSLRGTSNSTPLFTSTSDLVYPITTFNETNPTQVIRTTLTIVNNSGTYVYAEGVTPTIFSTTLSGYQQYTFSNSSYFFDQVFYFNPTLTGFNLPTKVYLLSKTYGFSVSQSVVLYNSQGQSISGIVSINKQISSTFTPLSQQLTGTGGVVVQKLDCLGSFTVTAYATGFNTFSGGLTTSCSNPQPLIIYMSQGNTFQWGQQPFQNVSFTFIPPDAILDQVTNVGFAISSTQGDLEYYNFTLAYANGTNFYNFSETSAVGLIINASSWGDDWTVPVNKDDKAPYITLGLNFKTYSMNSPYFISINKYVNVQQNYSVPPGLNLSNIGQGFSGFTFNILPIIFLIIMMGTLASFGFQGGLGILFFAGILVFVSFGWINAYLGIFAAIVAVAAAYIYSRSSE